jgi:hypothetical protein
MAVSIIRARFRFRGYSRILASFNQSGRPVSIQSTAWLQHESRQLQYRIRLAAVGVVNSGWPPRRRV